MSGPEIDPPTSTGVLVICTANICRSPVAAQMVRDRGAARGLNLSVGSAGFLEDGRPADATMAALALGRGTNVGDHRSRVIDEERLRGADVVVTMERRHARELVVMAPDVGHRIHTLLGLIEAGRFQPVQGNLDEWLGALTEGRQAADLMGDRGPDHVPDPHGRAKRHYRNCLDTLDEAVEDLVELLSPFAH
ncbi:MAG: hypothetical protein ACR2QE_01690 [Acidimicrobiales bacterium]